MRILFIGPTRIGDAVLSSGLLNYLIRNFPDARFTVACGVAAAPLFEAAPRVERVIAMTKLPHAGHWWRLWREVAGHRWSLVVDLRRSVISWTVLCARRAMAPASSTAQGEHAVVSFARTLGVSDNPPMPRLWTSEEQRAAAAELIPSGTPVLALGPTANWRGKTWRAENFVALAERLTADGGGYAPLPGARIAVFGAEGERDDAAPVVAAVPPERRIDLVGAIDLPTVAACLELCSLYIGNDSGLMHMAAASGIPTLGLFGPSRPERYAPWGWRTAWVRTEKDFDELVGGPGYDFQNTDTLMDSLAVDTVVEAAARLWQRAGREPD
jgi:heptosyltransferase-3